MQCAIWYADHGSTCVRVFDDETDAARFAAEYTDEALDGYVQGVQFDDGRTIDLVRGDWPAMEEAERAIRERRPLQSQPSPNRQRLASPFGGATEVFEDDDLPDWLGERQPW